MNNKKKRFLIETIKQGNKHNDINEYIPKKFKISNVKYGILSENEIRARSDASITKTKINESGSVVYSGVNDARLGVNLRSVLCNTCGQNSLKCQGHVGDIDLEYPCVNIEFLSIIHKVLTCVCFHCSKLLFTKAHRKFVSILAIKSKKKRFKRIYDVCSRIHVCGNRKENNIMFGSIDPCGGKQPVYKKKDITICAKFDDLSEHILTPIKMKRILQYISNEDIILLGMDPNNSHPVNMMWSRMIVPPVQMRPSSAYRVISTSNESDLTMSIRNIISENMKMKKYNKVDEIHLELDCNKTQILIDYMSLQRAVASYQDNKFSKNIEYNQDNMKKGLRERFTGKKAKKGRLRHCVFGKRQNYSARAVITPCCDMDIDEVGVPKWMCMKLIFKETVNQYNIHKMTDIIRNGPLTHPGANYVECADGNTYDLTVKNRFDICLVRGDVVHRHLINGDFVLLNRQPSLHKMSIMAHRVKIMDGNTFRLHMSVTKPYNADFDGDEMNLLVLMDYMSVSEARELVSVKKNIVKDTQPIVTFQQHSVLSAYLLTHPKCLIPVEIGHQLIYQYGIEHKDIPIAKTTKNGVIYYRGIELFSFILPKGLNIDIKDVQIVDGNLIRGRINKNILNSCILYTILIDIGEECACSFLSNGHRFLDAFLNIHGMSIGLDDCLLELKNKDITTGLAKSYIQQNYVQHNPCKQYQENSNDVELHICDILDKTRDLIGDEVLKQSKSKTNMTDNGLYHIVNSGAKGNETNLVQISGVVGQQYDHKSMRIGTFTSHYNTKKTHSERHGMIYSSFFGGLNSNEYFNHLIGSRVGLVDTAVKTAETGYSQRKLAKAMEDYVVYNDYSVRDSEKNIVQCAYGTDCLDSKVLELNTIYLLNTTVENIKNKFKWTINNIVDYKQYNRRRKLMLECEAKEIDNLIDIKRILMKYTDGNDKCLLPFNFERLFLKITTCDEDNKENSIRDLTQVDVFKTVLGFWNCLSSFNYISKTIKLKSLFFEKCSVHNLYTNLKVNKFKLTKILKSIFDSFACNTITPYESVGISAAQHCVEPLTQMTLNRFHKSGQLSRVGDDVVRMKELINANKTIKHPSMKIMLANNINAIDIGNMIIEITGNDVITNWINCIPNVHIQRNYEFIECYQTMKVEHIIFVYMNKSNSIRFKISPRKFAEYILNQFEGGVIVSHSLLTVDTWWVCINISKENKIFKKLFEKHCGTSDYTLLMLFEYITKTNIIKGAEGINDFHVNTIRNLEVVGDIIKNVDRTIIVTDGSNIRNVIRELGDTQGIISVHTNDIREIEKFFGIDAVMYAIETEWKHIMNINGAYVGMRHIKLITEAMCRRGVLTAMNFEGICKDDLSTIKKASFEKVMESFVWGSVNAKIDKVSAYTDNICWNNKLNAGTGMVHIFHENVNIPKEIQIKNAETYMKRYIRVNNTTDILKKYINHNTDIPFAKSIDYTHRFVPYSPQKKGIKCSKTDYFIPSSP